MSDLSSLKSQLLELKRLQSKAKLGSIVRRELDHRIQSVERRINALVDEAGQRFPSSAKRDAEPARVALFLSGGGVEGSNGIRPGLAAEALLQYEKMYVQQAIDDERQVAREEGRHRRRRGSPTPGLLFTGTPRGSFGLEFTPQTVADAALAASHAVSLERIADALVAIGSSEDAAGIALSAIPPGALVPMKRFFQILAQNDVELQVAYSSRRSVIVSAEKIKRTSENLDHGVHQSSKKLDGVLRGITLESAQFDFLPDAAENAVSVISGQVAGERTAEDLERLLALTNRPCTATFEVTTTENFTGATRESFILVDAEPREGSETNPPINSDGD